MNETLKATTTQERHRLSMEAKAAAKEARLKTALRGNLRRRKESVQSPPLPQD
jgi:hypothetical protein